MSDYMEPYPATDVDQWLRPFRLIGPLHDHAVHVVAALPEAVRAELSAEPGVTFSDYDPTPGAVMHVRVGPPGRVRPARSVVLKRTLAGRPPAFVRWLIAHELAHAYLRNAGRWPGDDPEVAADALAAEWGFPRPAMPRW